MSADLEREELAEVAREVACEKVGQCFTQGTDVMLIARAVKAAKYAYLAAATLREKEIEELRALLREACGILNDAIKTDETFWLEEMRGTNEDLTERIMLMLPPTPVPETKP